MQSFVEVQRLFQFTETVAAYKLLFDCLLPIKIESIGAGSETFHANIKYHKLLQITSLYGFKLNLNVSTVTGSLITKATRASFPKDVVELLDSVIKPDNISGFELKNNESLPYNRIKFSHEDKVDIAQAHPDFLKIVAIMRIAHISTLSNMKPSTENAKKVSSLVTYGLLTEKKFVRVLGIRVIVPETQRKIKTYKYILYNVGTFPIEPTTENEKLEFDNLLTFLLEACRNTFYEENELIEQITKRPFGRPKLESMPIASSHCSKEDKLVIQKIGKDITLETSVTLKEYFLEWGTIEGQGGYQKDIFYGEIDHSSKLVFVKICYDEKQQRIPSNIFLPIDKVYHNGALCTHHVEISLAGDDFITSSKRTPSEKMYIFTQLLLEIEQIHSKQYIHNDVKPNNIIIIGESENSSFRCKFIDFEMSYKFDKEDGDVCYDYSDRLCESTAGTPDYNAPEKQSGEDNYIHPKTDIFSLGLIFIELILEKTVKYSKEFENDCFWIDFKSECKKQFGHKGKLILEMVQKMVCKERSHRITATECLQLLGITETVDKTDYTNVFFPNSSDSNTGKNQPSTVLDFSPTLQPSIKRCCHCKIGTCMQCKCKDKDECLNCNSTNCSKRRKKDKSSGERNKRNKII
ncbi:hypothetical protein ABK040_002568 [Willaertia magna]